MPSAPCTLPFGRSVLVLLVVATGAGAQELREVRGRVIDDAGKPIAGATVDAFWRANGTGKGPDGKFLDLAIEENVKTFWGHLGEMEPFTARAVVTGNDGRFAVMIPTRYHALMALDRDRKRGGLIVLPRGKEEEPVEIRVGPLVALRGAFMGPGGDSKPGWTHVYLHLPDDLTRPLDTTRLVSCGSFEGRFAMTLPPGRYVLEGYNETTDARLVPVKEITLDAGKPEVDLGTLALTNTRTEAQRAFAQARESKDWIDVADRYGKPAPRWHITDAKGLSKTAQIDDFRGKWVLIYFWGFNCAPCLKTGLPSLTKFYEEHAADRDRFEIVAFCLGEDLGVTTIADVDRKLMPIVEHVWDGRPLPFPIALDASFETMERFGITVLGPHLVDPQGVLIKGDETVLAEKLKRADRPRP